MTDRVALLLAGTTMLGALVARPVPAALLVAATLIALAALAWGRPFLLVAALAVTASGLGARAWEGVRNAPTHGLVAGPATLLTDPQDLDGATRTELRLAGRRLEAYARGPAAGSLRTALAGERVAVRGRRSPVTGRRRAYLARRHVGARLNLTEVRPLDAGPPPARLANAVRRSLLRGAAPLRSDQRALLAGFVLGDDRDQPVEIVDDFRGAGLTHLLAVSGQNVAFTLAVCSPLLLFLGRRSRYVAALTILVLFGVLTRWEPSVIRAAAMAAVALTAGTLGRPASTARVLALAVTALVLVDPLLAGALGFLLSAGACAGIALLSGPLQRRLPAPVAITLAAQAGVAPILVPVFGGIPVASLPANLLAGPVAGTLMIWGMAAGIPAGLLPAPIPALAHIPTGWMLRWVAGVARWGAWAPLGILRAGHVLALAGLLVTAVVAVGRMRAAAVAAALAVLALPGLTQAVFGSAPTAGAPIASGARLWHDGGRAVLVADGTARPGPVLAALRQHGVRRLDVLVVPARHRLAPVLRRVPATTIARAGSHSPPLGFDSSRPASKIEPKPAV